MKNKINLRLVGIAILAVLTTVVAITIVYYSLFQKQVRADLQVSAKLLKDTEFFESVNIDVDRIDLSADISELRVTWIDSDGTVLYDNDASAIDLENHSDRPEIRGAFETGSGESVRRSDTMNENTFYYAILLDNGTVLRVATNVRSIWSLFLSALPLIILIIGIIIAICVVLSHLLTKQLIAPIEQMATNLEDRNFEAPYIELTPFANMIRTQHTDILSAAKARQDFTANVSHELKTPLTAISGYAELMENGMVGADKQGHFAEEIKKNADRLLSLINDIIRLSELDRSAEKEVGFEEVDLNRIVSECMEGLKVSAEKRNVTLTYEGVPCVLRANKEMLQELIDNLVLNAIRYNNEGGRVWVRVSSEPERTLIVKDNGIGIPTAEQERIFERFYRVDKSRSKATGGTGLGLAIVKHIVEIHDAKLTLDSAPGVGTTVKIEF